MNFGKTSIVAMSTQLGKLCSLLLQEYFGDTVEKVGMDLFRHGPKPASLICNSTKLATDDVSFNHFNHPVKFNLTKQLSNI